MNYYNMYQSLSFINKVIDGSFFYLDFFFVVVKRLIDELLSDLAFKLIKVLLLGLLKHVRMQSVLHVSNFTPHVFLKLSQLFLA